MPHTESTKSYVENILLVVPCIIPQTKVREMGIKNTLAQSVFGFQVLSPLLLLQPISVLNPMQGPSSLLLFLLQCPKQKCCPSQVQSSWPPSMPRMALLLPLGEAALPHQHAIPVAVAPAAGRLSQVWQQLQLFVIGISAAMIGSMMGLVSQGILHFH